MKKRALLCGLTLLMAAASFSCGKINPQTEVSSSETETTIAETAQAEETTAADGEESAETTTKRNNSDSGFGMMKYIKKSRRSTANANARMLFRAITAYMYEKYLMADTDIAYMNTADGELSKAVKELYFNSDKDYDYVILFDDNGQPATVLVPFYEKNNYVGCYSENGDTEEYEGMKWNEVLEKFGFTKGEYTDPELVDDISAHYTMPQSSEEKTINLADPKTQTIFAWAIMARDENEYLKSDKEVVYLRHSKDEPFPDEEEWELPEHGDIECILVYDSGELYRVLAWDCDTEKCYVGDSYFGDCDDDLAYIGWDAVLEAFGLTEGEYTG